MPVSFALIVHVPCKPPSFKMHVSVAGDRGRLGRERVLETVVMETAAEWSRALHEPQVVADSSTATSAAAGAPCNQPRPPPCRHPPPPRTQRTPRPARRLPRLSPT